VIARLQVQPVGKVTIGRAGNCTTRVGSEHGFHEIRRVVEQSQMMKGCQTAQAEATASGVAGWKELPSRTIESRTKPDVLAIYKYHNNDWCEPGGNIKNQARRTCKSRNQQSVGVNPVAAGKIKNQARRTCKSRNQQSVTESVKYWRRQYKCHKCLLMRSKKEMRTKV